ncbi:MAG: alkaline phosphatase family protein [Pyrinomonadaceae bacterium]
MARLCKFILQSPPAFGLRVPVIILAILILAAPNSLAQAKRLVVLKVDGLPYSILDSAVQERNPRTGKSQLPWIEHVFYQRGARLSNFYVRGMSLSAPSWSLLDTGQHLQVKGNVEFDRYTLHTYDYLNFIPFYFKSAEGSRIDMPGAEVLDSLGLPLLCDAFPHEQRYISFQLYQRGMRFATLRDGLQNRFVKNPRELLDEWTMGLQTRSVFFKQLEKELIQSLDNPQIRYLDLYVSNFDHVAHHNRDRQSQMIELQEMDGLVGRIWTAIEKSSLAAETAFVMVSDHGFNTDEKIYSQGYNLVKLLGSRSGGGHHVITKRRLLLDYSIKGVYFMVPLITTTTDDSYYLKGQSTSYPTVLLDFDGNERASIHLRDNDLNLLHILLQQLQRNKLPVALRRAATDAFFATVERRRAGWQKHLDELNEELKALRSRIEEHKKLWEAQPKQFARREIELGYDDQKKRLFAQLEKSMGQEKTYSEYASTLANLLALRKESFAPLKLKLEDLIAKQAMGERNSIYQLQNYIVGEATGGLQLRVDGSLDLEKSFARVDYFTLLQSITVKNNVQSAVSNRPIDLVANRIPSSQIEDLVSEENLTSDVIWVNGGADKQALILAREDSKGDLSFRYLPIKDLTEDAQGNFHFETIALQRDLPLRIFEDEQLIVPRGQDRHAWLSAWHTDLEWLNALHLTKYSNGLVGLYEELAHHRNPRLDLDEAGISEAEQLNRRFTQRQRNLAEADLLIVANNHWNFDVRGFNPGGNHGSFLRVSTHSTFMLAGGDNTQLPRGVVVDQPYDSLSFMPTMLALTGNLRDDKTPLPVLWSKGFRRFPGRLVKEILPATPGKDPIAVTGASPTH